MTCCVLQSGLWVFGHTPLEYARSVSDESEGQLEILFLEALALHSQVRWP